jgi:hypothetical protein
MAAQVLGLPGFRGAQRFHQELPRIVFELEPSLPLAMLLERLIQLADLLADDRTSNMLERTPRFLELVFDVTELLGESLGELSLAFHVR